VRLDKFLQATRLVKRRTLANRLCEAGKVTLNGRKAKPAAEVRVGDLISLTLGPRRLVARVWHLPTRRPSTEEPVQVLEDVRDQEAW
jgi:ribosomal 50S subunit-recycling heat shock protein